MTDSAKHRLLYVLIFLVIGAGLIAALGAPVQVLLSGLYWCGRIGAGATLYVLFVVAAAQTALFILSQYYSRLRGLYSASQALALSFCIFQVGVLGVAYPDTAAITAAALAISLAVVALIQVAEVWPSLSSSDSIRGRVCYTASLAAAFLLQVVVFSALLAQFFAYDPRTPLTNAVLNLCIAAGVILAIFGTWSINKKASINVKNVDLASFAPLFILLLALLRAKYPDGAFDSFSYKATVPHLIAEWRTAGMAFIDPAMLGTNFQELLNGLILIVSPQYYPSLVSTWSTTALFAILPLAIAIGADAPRFQRLIGAFAAAVIVCLTEPAIAQGTSYQEPFIALMMAAALINSFVWPLFLAGALGTKFTAITALPLFFAYKFLYPNRDERVPSNSSGRVPALRLGAAVLLLGIFFLPQIERNLTYTGRVLGLSETLAGVTDPPGEDAILAPGEALSDGRPRGGVLNNLMLSACNALTMDLFCPITFEGDVIFGFHVLPSSRAPMVAFTLAVCGLIGAMILGRGKYLIGAPCAAFLIGYFVFLSAFSQGRYFVVPAFQLALLALCIAMALREDSLGVPVLGRAVHAFGMAALILLPIGDLMVGVFINDGWECRRDLFARAETYDFVKPRNEAETFLRSIADGYQKSCRPPGAPPAIFVQPQVVSAPQYPLLSPYLGLPRILEYRAPDMNERFFAANPKRSRLFPRAVLAIVAKDEAALSKMAGKSRDKYSSCYESGELKIYCSTELAPFGKECAKSIFKR